MYVQVDFKDKEKTNEKRNTNELYTFLKLVQSIDIKINNTTKKV